MGFGESLHSGVGVFVELELEVEGFGYRCVCDIIVPGIVSIILNKAAANNGHIIPGYKRFWKTYVGPIPPLVTTKS